MSAEDTNWLNKKPTDYWWEITGSTVWLHEGFHKPTRYNKSSLEFTISNVRNARGTYATQAAYDVQLRKFELGLSILKVGQMGGNGGCQP